MTEVSFIIWKGCDRCMQSRWMKRRNDNGQEERFYPITHADAVVDLDTKIQENVESVTDSLSSHIENTDVHFSPQERDKLNTIEEGANKTIVDTSLSSTSSNAIANKAVQSAIQTLTDSKANKSDIPTKVSQLTNDSGYLTSSTTPVKSVNGKTGAVTLTSSDVGLGNVNNTSDANKPVSTAQAAAIKVVQDGLNDHTGNEDIHFTATERTKLAGIATGANKYTHPTSGVTAGTYRSVTVDSNGHVTNGTNPTTLAGYGITDAEAKGTVNTHNTSTSAHNDIRLLVSDISTKLNNFLNVSDTTKDQLSEIISLIEENADDIESITSGKVNVSDIINNLTTNVTNKPLSAAQGVAIKTLLDELSASITTRLNNEKTARENGDAQTLTAAKEYTDTRLEEKIQSNYDLWLSLGYTGTPEDFLEWLRDGSGSSSASTNLSGLLVKDTYGILGTVNVEVNAQTLIDNLAKRIIDLQEIAEIAETI